jgi:peptidoglycan/LPS O-acetylase OafA/YrhL
MGSDDSYGIYLSQLVYITALGWVGWRHLNAYMPWPILSLITVVIVFTACVVLTELLARTALAKALTGRSRIVESTSDSRTGRSTASVTPT